MEVQYTLERIKKQFEENNNKNFRSRVEFTEKLIKNLEEFRIQAQKNEGHSIPFRRTIQALEEFGAFFQKVDDELKAILGWEEKSGKAFEAEYNFDFIQDYNFIPEDEDDIDGEIYVGKLILKENKVLNAIFLRYTVKYDYSDDKSTHVIEIFKKDRIIKNTYESYGLKLHMEEIFENIELYAPEIKSPQRNRSESPLNTLKTKDEKYEEEIIRQLEEEEKKKNRVHRNP